MGVGEGLFGPGGKGTSHSHKERKGRGVLSEKARAGGGRLPGEVSHRAPPDCGASPQWPPGGAAVPRRLQSMNSRAGVGRGTTQPAPVPAAGQTGAPAGKFGSKSRGKIQSCLLPEVLRLSAEGA